MESQSSDQSKAKLAFSEEMVSRLNAGLDSHDARTGIFLAAIALMVTAGSAALTDQTIRDTRFILPNGAKLPLPALSLGLFLVFAVAAATYLVLSLGPPEPPPRSQSELSLVRPSSIETDQWKQLYRIDNRQFDKVREEICYKDFQYLANRALYKYQRLVEARAAFFLSLPFLLNFVVLVMFLPHSGSNVGLSWTASTLCSTVLFLTTFVAGQDRVRIDRIDRAIDAGINVNKALRKDDETFGVLTICLAINSALTLSSAMVGQSGTAEALLPIASFLVTVPAAWKLVKRRRAEHFTLRHRALDRLSPYFIIMLGMPGLLCGLISEIRPVCLISAFLPSLFFEGIRLLDFYFQPAQVALTREDK
jgi:hypothetical protein